MELLMLSLSGTVEAMAEDYHKLRQPKEKDSINKNRKDALRITVKHFL